MAYYAPRPQTDEDPFESGEKTPSLSWRDQPVGTVFVLEVLEPTKKLQSRNYNTNKPDYWDDDPASPKMAAVVNVLVQSGPHSVGEKRSIWAQIPSNLFVEIREAQKTAGARLAPGGILQLKFVGEVPHTDPKKHPIKQYKARYSPPATGDAEDPFADAAPSAPPAQQPRPAFMGPRPVAPAQPSAKKGW